MLHVTLMY